MTRRLQVGDPGGHIRRALAEFPFPEMVSPILQRYYIAGGKSPDVPFLSYPLPAVKPTRRQLEMIVVANFVEVYLAKEDHDGLVGINYLEKIQLPTLPSLYGAMLADVDYVLMGAGIPRSIPGILDRLSQGEAVELALHVDGADRQDRFTTSFDPREFSADRLPWVRRPKFLAIVASATLASMLARKANGHVDGFIVEGPTAGGHNAPPRGAMQVNDRGEPLYGERDIVDLSTIEALGRPFWLAGSYGRPEKVAEALSMGAAGVQVGTAFAFCEESGLTAEIRRRVVQKSRENEVDVKTDAVASPAGFPFKVLQLDDTLSNDEVYRQRRRVCDLGYLRHAYKREDGTLGWRCGAEDVDAFLRKGGTVEGTSGKKCVCNGLVANVGLPQIRRDGSAELPLLTSGDDAREVARFLSNEQSLDYTAQDVVNTLLEGIPTVPDEQQHQAVSK
jgi:nitronate monooxygenase